jgi:hypothetical protein
MLHLFVWKIRTSGRDRIKSLTMRKEVSIRPRRFHLALTGVQSFPTCEDS